MKAAVVDTRPLSPERLLLQLALELSSAQDSLTATEALGRYLGARFQPAQVARRELERAQASESHPLFAGGGAELSFVFPLSLPLAFDLSGCAASRPTDDELLCLEQATRAFRDRLETLAELKGLTYTDDLTGLYNQRYLELILDRELSLAKRNGTQFSVLFLDLDHFKSVNDSHGHLIGSRLLYEVGQEIKRALRESDVCFRYGGDEFVIILSLTGLDDAVLVAERIRVQIEKKRFLARENMDVRLTASIGVASVPLHAVTKQQILKAADEALYGVKKAVRNSVIAATCSAEE